jgi:hypothetical protein
MPDADPAPGVLFDISASGASFFISQRRNAVPHTGEEIVLRRDTAAAASQLYNVIRVEPLAHGYVLVGCSRAADVEVLGDGVRLPRLTTGVNSHPRAWRSPRRTVATFPHVTHAHDSSASAPA